MSRNFGLVARGGALYAPRRVRGFRLRWLLRLAEAVGILAAGLVIVGGWFW